MVIDLGDRPTPEIEPAEPAPGGVDAIDEQTGEPPVVPDLSLVGNEAVDKDLPDELTEPEDTGEGASNDGASEPEKESQA
jgi:hypothetical protein